MSSNLRVVIMNPTLNPIDLRSDTITKPTPAMRQAMAEAEVGDDVFGDDPTVAMLERETAAILGKEAALFVPSGTMANQIAVRAHTEPGDELIIEGQSHIYYYEGGGPAALSGVMCRCINGRRGIFTAAELESVIRPADPHFPRTRLVCIENTHNRGGGKVWPLEDLSAVARAARHRGLSMHLDGARLWNASIASGVAERDYADLFDSVSVCFSKGLGAPVGSALVGTKEFIERARRFRKMLGGGMRQAGIIAAGALHALRHHRARLAEDHANARLLAGGLAAIARVEIVPSEVETNMVRFSVRAVSAPEFCARLQERGVRVLPMDARTIRAVTSLMVTAEDIQNAIRGVAALAGN
jgi:threonine aldolase